MIEVARPFFLKGLANMVEDFWQVSNQWLPRFC